VSFQVIQSFGEWELGGGIPMSPRICICCGETMTERGNALSRNPNICASCSSLADGMEESSLPALPETGSALSIQPPSPPRVVPAPAEVVVLEWIPQDEAAKRREAAVSRPS
jgi:hypothetical protein